MHAFTGAWYIRIPPRETAPGEKAVTTVIVEPDKSFETALTRFEKPRENSGRLYELRTPRHHDEPGLERTPIALVACKKAQKRERLSA